MLDTQLLPEPVTAPVEPALRILFVDDDQNVLDGLRRLLNGMRNQWEMEFARNAADALEKLGQQPYTVVVSDLRMPGMDGVQLLDEVKRRYPLVIRIMLSAHTDQVAALRSVRTTHQFLPKPCDPKELRATIHRAFSLRRIMLDPSLKELVSQVTSLPALPAIHAELVKELESPTASINRAADIISLDIAMTAKLLQLVNSSFFGLRYHVASPADAARLLGIETLQALVLSVQLFSQFEQLNRGRFSIDALMSHSLTVAAYAKSIAVSETSDRATTDHAFLGGLLHDVGKLVLAANLPQKYCEAIMLARREQLPIVAGERITFGVSHAEVGAYLLGLWGLPEPIVEAVAFHHTPSTCAVRTFTPLAAVHVADALEHELRANPDMAPPPLDKPYLTRIEVFDRLPTWRAGCIETLEEARARG